MFTQQKPSAQQRSVDCGGYSPNTRPMQPWRGGLVATSSTEIWPLAVYTLMVILLVITMLVLSWLLGQRRREDATNEPFESGIVSVGNSQIRISVEFIWSPSSL
jgi:hypothetical protein